MIGGIMGGFGPANAIAGGIGSDMAGMGGVTGSDSNDLGLFGGVGGGPTYPDPYYYPLPSAPAMIEPAPQSYLFSVDPSQVKMDMQPWGEYQTPYMPPMPMYNVPINSYFNDFDWGGYFNNFGGK